MKKVLVTGASGFIGKHSLPLLAKRGYEVFPLSSKQQRDKNYKWVTANFLQTEEMSNVIKHVKPNFLLHFAWYTQHGLYWNAPENLDWVRSSLELLKSFALNGGKRVVIAGSCAEYDWNDSICKENNSFQNPQNFYGICKSSLYQMAYRFAQLQNLNLAWGRIFYLFGPNEQKTRLIPSAILSFLHREKFLCSGANLIRDFSYVKDIADAFVSLLDSSVNGVVNLASGTGTSIKMLIEMIAENLHAKNLVQFRQKNEIPSLIANTKRLQEELKWRPKFDLKTALNETIEWWQKNDDSFKN